MQVPRCAGAVITATGDLTMGNASDLLGFSHGGELQVGTNAVTLNSAGFARPGVLTTLARGGTLTASNGLLLDNGDNLIGSGTVLAPIAAGFGSTIIVGEGELHLGDPTALDGFFSDVVINRSGGRSRTGLRDVMRHPRVPRLTAYKKTQVDLTDGSGTGCRRGENRLARYTIPEFALAGPAACRSLTRHVPLRGIVAKRRRVKPP